MGKNVNKCYKNEARELTTLFYDNLTLGSYFLELKSWKKIYKGTIKNPLKLNQIVSITTDLLQGLLFLKGNDIIHADLKPENILDDGKEHVVICFQKYEIKRG